MSTEKIFVMVNSRLLVSTRFLIPKILIAPRIGIDNKNDIFAESYLLNFKILAAEIAIPDLLTPGTKDRT